MVDLQKGLVGLPTAHPFDGVVKQRRRTDRGLSCAQLPVVLINVDGSSAGSHRAATASSRVSRRLDRLYPELNRQPGDHVVTKRTWGAFTGTDLEQYLRASDVTQVVVVGVATSAGVESTARHAHELGFNVTLAIDAMTDLDADAHHNSVAQIFPKLGETGTARQLIGLLDLASGAST